MTTTTKLGDFLGRALVNDTPGSSNATDFLGRGIGSSTVDYSGQILVTTPNFPPPDWLATTAYTVGVRVGIPGTKEVQTITAVSSPATGNLVLGIDNGDGSGAHPTPNIVVSTISAPNIQAAILALDNVNPGDVAVSGSGPYSVTWAAEFGNVPQLTCNNSAVVGGTYTPGTTTTGAVLEQILECAVAGTSASSKPAAPAIGASVTDGTVHWNRLK